MRQVKKEQWYFDIVFKVSFLNLQSDTEDDEIVMTKVVLNEITTNKFTTTFNKIETSEDIDLSFDEDDDNGAWFDDSFKLYLSEVLNC